MAAERVLVDSGGWIGFFHARDQHHADADRAMRHALRAGVPLVTTVLILAEVHRFVLFRAGPRAARAALDRVERSRGVEILFPDAALHAAALAWLARLRDQRISYTDAVSFAVMQALPCRAVLGFDADFAIAGFPRWQPD